DQTDPHPNDNTASASTTVQGPRLDFTKQTQPGALHVGTQFKYTLTVKNNGPGTVTGAKITDPLPSGQSYVPSTATQGSCLSSAGTVTCNLGTVANGQTVTVTITVNPSVKGVVTNTATFSTNETSAQTANANADIKK